MLPFTCLSLQGSLLQRAAPTCSSTSSAPAAAAQASSGPDSHGQAASANLSIETETEAIQRKLEAEQKKSKGRGLLRIPSPGLPNQVPSEPASSGPSDQGQVGTSSDTGAGDGTGTDTEKGASGRAAAIEAMSAKVSAVTKLSASYAWQGLSGLSAAVSAPGRWTGRSGSGPSAADAVAGQGASTEAAEQAGSAATSSGIGANLGEGSSEQLLLRVEISVLEGDQSAGSSGAEDAATQQQRVAVTLHALEPQQEQAGGSGQAGLASWVYGSASTAASRIASSSSPWISTAGNYLSAAAKKAAAVAGSASSAAAGAAAQVPAGLTMQGLGMSSSRQAANASSRGALGGGQAGDAGEEDDDLCDVLEDVREVLTGAGGLMLDDVGGSHLPAQPSPGSTAAATSAAAAAASAAITSLFASFKKPGVAAADAATAQAAGSTASQDLGAATAG